MENSRLCLICSLNCKGNSTDLNKLRRNPDFRNFLRSLGEDNEDGLNTCLINLLGGEVNCGFFKVCENCRGLIWEAMEWRGRVGEVESKVVGLQGKILEELRRLEEYLGEFGGKLRRIRENVRMEVVQLTFDEDGGGDQEVKIEHMEGMEAISGEEHRKILGEMERKMDGVVADLDKFQDNLSNKIDDKRIQRRLKRQKLKSAQFNDSDMDSNLPADNNDLDLSNQDNPTSNLNGDSDWSPPPSPSNAVPSPSTNHSKGSARPANQKRSGKFTFRNQVTRLIINRQKRFASHQQPCTPHDLKYPINYDPTLDKITIGQTTEILITKDKCRINHLQCTLCDFQTPNLSKQSKQSYLSVECIYDHVIKNHYGGYNCELCGKVAPSRKKFLEHLIIHREPDKFTCEICGRPCQTYESIKLHRFTHFNEEEKRRELEEGRATWWQKEKVKAEDEEGIFNCETCGKSFSKLMYLRKHERIHENVVICPICGKRVTKNWYRKYHSVYKCPLGDGEGEGGKGVKVKCWQCGKMFMDLMTLRKHLKRMHSKEAEERSWICDKCGKGYKAREDLRTHEKVHAEGMEWRCDECGREFNQKKNYKRHKCAVKVEIN